MSLSDTQLRDNAVNALKLTTVGYKNKSWSNPPKGSEWEIALTALAQIGQTQPIPTPIKRLDFSTGDLKQWFSIRGNQSGSDSDGIGYGSVSVISSGDLSAYAAKLSFATTKVFSADMCAPELIDRWQPLATSMDFIGYSYYFPSGNAKPSEFWGIVVGETGYPDPTEKNYGYLPQSTHQFSWVGLGTKYEQLVLSVKAGSIDGSGQGTYNSGYPITDLLPRGISAIGGAGPFAPIPPGRMTLDTWHHLILGVNWSTRSNGSFQVWHYRPGIDTAWEVTVPLISGIPTMAFDPAQGADCYTPASYKRIMLDAYTKGAHGPVELHVGGLFHAPDLATAKASFG